MNKFDYSVMLQEYRNLMATAQYYHEDALRYINAGAYDYVTQERITASDLYRQARDLRDRIHNIWTPPDQWYKHESES